MDTQDLKHCRNQDLQDFRIILIFTFIPVIVIHVNKTDIYLLLFLISWSSLNPDNPDSDFFYEHETAAEGFGAADSIK